MFFCCCIFSCFSKRGFQSEQHCFLLFVFSILVDVVVGNGSYSGNVLVVVVVGGGGGSGGGGGGGGGGVLLLFFCLLLHHHCHFRLFVCFFVLVVVLLGVSWLLFYDGDCV